jgi:hypothetical protein
MAPLAVPPGSPSRSSYRSRDGNPSWGRLLASRKLPTVKLPALPGSDHGRNQLRVGNDAPGSAPGATPGRPAGTSARRADPVVLQGYDAYFPGQPRIIVARDRDPAGVNAALSLALARARQHACSRIWLVRTHLLGAERAAWTAALRQRGLVSTRAGAHGLRVVQPSRGSAGGPARCPGGGPAVGR